MEEYIGYDDRDCFRVICADHARKVTAEEFDRFRELKEASVQMRIERGDVKAFAGTLALSEALVGKVTQAICSGALRREIEPIVGRLGLRDRFATIVTADDVPKAKPDPAGYVMTAAKINAAPGACVVIEDTPTGCRAAIAAGMSVIAVCHSLPASVFPTGVRMIVSGTAELTAARVLNM
jgi:HAD superfamily hydrolase (TIGR01509 family)